ncbi:NMD5 Nonsense-mediated mRNA decay protein 5 [Candida maltosa Xu316]|uniref:Nonsense-mediated mRNA decay-like protein, putative n=1 Tax=Candida maltosa (strain Xu316) TaxID=1245528 RepID=M3IM97_CANMX|nr:Nonsense-mediated mRNA decay-like protein, putative [Candida maltosa Xu316]
MDSNLILECFAGTLQTDPNLRNQAESKLKELSVSPGFLGACLDIIDNSSTPVHAKKSVAVYFKNRIIKYWNTKDKKFQVDNDEKPIVKDRLLPVIINCDYNVKQQLIPVLRLLIALEFDNWPGLLDQTGQLLQSGNSEDYLYNGMLCFAEISRKYKWVDNKERERKLYPIINQAFPHLLTIGNAIVANNEMTELRAEILKLILKSYKFVTYYDLPEPLQSKESILTWGEFHASVINMKPPSYVVDSDASEQEKSFLQISKCYKWAIANIYRLFIRYASSTELTRKFHYKEFHDLFLTDFVPHFIGQFLSIIEEFCQGKRWLGTSAIFQILEFLSHCIVEKTTWTLVKPYLETLITYLVYPILCPTTQALEIYEEDPQEYINLNFDQTVEYDSPENAALGFIETALYKQPKSTLPPISNFIYQQLTELQSQPEETLEIAQKKEGALRILGSVSGYLPQDNSIEPMLASLVVPCLNSKFEFLQARAISSVSQFSGIPFNNQETLSAIIHGILRNFDSNQEISLPVLFESALAIQAFMSNEEFKQVLANIVLPTMSKLLELSNEIDSDAISVVMQECVENFSEQLQPFGVDLMTKLVQQFLKLAHEINEAANADIDDFDGNDNGDKVMAAVGFVNTMITVLLSFENSREICLKLEEIFSEAIQYVFANDLDDFFAEIGELMENSTFLLRSISPIMIKDFHMLFEAFRQGLAVVYFEELCPPLKNLMLYNNQDELNNQLFEVFQIVASSDYNDSIELLEYLQFFILTLKEKVAPYIGGILEFISGMDLENRSLKGSFAVNTINVILAAIIWSSPDILASMPQGWFDIWVQMTPTRVYEIKLYILAICKIQSIEPQAVLESKLETLVKALPSAEEKLASKRRDFDISAIGSVADKFGDEEGNANGQEEDDDDDEQGEIDDYHVFGAGNFISSKDDEVYEDPLAVTPLDDVDVSQYL